MVSPSSRRKDPFSTTTSLSPQLKAAAGAQTSERPIYVRADGRASYEVVAQVMASLSTSGFTKINLITDTGGPSSGGEETPEG